MATLIEETWFIGVMAGAGALILVLVIIIVVLICMWRKRLKREKEEKINAENNNNENQPAAFSENWTLVQPGVIHSPPSAINTDRVVRGNEANIAGSSLIHMNKEMRVNAVNMSTQTTLTNNTVEKALKEIGQNGVPNGHIGRKPSFGAELNSSKLNRSEVRSSFQKPRLANVSVTSSKTSGITHDSSQSSVYPYRLPVEDYDTVGTILYRDSPLRASVASERGKVKDLATSYERWENKPGYSPPVSPSRQKVVKEIKEIKEIIEKDPPLKKRLNVSPQKKVISYVNGDVRDNEHGRLVSGVTAQSGKSTTIETRVSRYKKVGAVSVFPD